MYSCYKVLSDVDCPFSAHPLPVPEMSTLATSGLFTSQSAEQPGADADADPEDDGTMSDKRAEILTPAKGEQEREQEDAMVLEQNHNEQDGSELAKASAPVAASEPAPVASAEVSKRYATRRVLAAATVSPPPTAADSAIAATADYFVADNSPRVPLPLLGACLRQHIRFGDFVSGIQIGDQVEWLSVHGIWNQGIVTRFRFDGSILRHVKLHCAGSFAGDCVWIAVEDSRIAPPGTHVRPKGSGALGPRMRVACSDVDPEHSIVDSEIPHSPAQSHVAPEVAALPPKSGRGKAKARPRRPVATKEADAEATEAETSPIFL